MNATPVASVIVAVLLVACGGSDGHTCGAGTKLVEDECVAVGSAGAGGSASSAGGGGSAAGGGIGGAGGSGKSGAGGGGVPAGSDPCPAPPASQFERFSDCSGECEIGLSCSSVIAGCYSATMDAEFGSYIDKLTLRTADHPGTRAACVSACTPGNTVFAHKIRISATGTGSPTLHYRAYVAAPWKIVTEFNGDGNACIHATTKSCVSESIWKVSSQSIFVVTEDPEAPARNVIIDKGDCP